jgi:hypothetical protein
MVLRAARRPLSPRAILAAAYRAGIVPNHLFGKAQHKTLQARLSEDILRFKLDSRFYRTDPGIFFLSEFRSDPKIADELKDFGHFRSLGGTPSFYRIESVDTEMTGMHLSIDVRLDSLTWSVTKMQACSTTI